MKLLAELNDKIILGTAGMSNASPRQTARAIVKDGQSKYAIMYYEKFNFHSLPGGGIEVGEGVVDALERELKEELGVVCGTIRELGIVMENRAGHDFTQKNHYFAVEAAEIGEPHPTEKEKANQAKIKWCSFDELYALVSTAEHKLSQRKYIKARDLVALDEYKRIFNL